MGRCCRAARAGSAMRAGRYTFRRTWRSCVAGNRMRLRETGGSQTDTPKPSRDRSGLLIAIIVLVLLITAAAFFVASQFLGRVPA
jgi:hypothetical protein